MMTPPRAPRPSPPPWPPSASPPSLSPSPPASSMSRPAAWATLNTPVRFVFSTCCHSMGVMSRARWRKLMPALFTTTSTRRSGQRRPRPGRESPTSQAMPPGEGWRERSVTVQPSSAKARHRRGADTAAAAGDHDRLAGKTVHRRDSSSPGHGGRVDAGLAFAGASRRLRHGVAGAARCRGVTRIVHAGDVGSLDVLVALQAIAPVTAVRGNVDTSFGVADLPEEAVVAVVEHRLLVGHVGEVLLRRHERLARAFRVSCSATRIASSRRGKTVSSTSTLVRPAVPGSGCRAAWRCSR